MPISSKTVTVPRWAVVLASVGLIALAGNNLRPAPNQLVSPRVLTPDLQQIANPIAKPFPLFASAISEAKYTPSQSAAVGLGELETLYRSRPDLQAAFGGDEVDLPRLLDWAINATDSGAFRIAAYRAGYRDVEHILNEFARGVIVSPMA